MMRFLNLILFALVSLFIFFIFFHTDSGITEDLGRHLLMGKIIISEKSVPKINLFSYTYPTYPFINHHWGSEVIFYLIDRVFNINGLIVVKIIVVLTALLLLIGYTNLKERNPYIVVGISVLVLEIIRNRSEIRPEMFGYLCFSLFLIILYNQKEKKSKIIWLLPVLLLLWVNLHISYIFGISLFVLYLFDRIILKKTSKQDFVLLFFLLIVSLINPNGLEGALYPFKIFSNYGYTIVENQSLFYLENIFQIPAFFYFKLTFLLFVLCIVPLLRHKKIFETFSAFGFGVLSFMAVRNFPFFALSSLVPIVYGLQILTQQKIFLSKKFDWMHGKIVKAIFYFFLVIFISKELHGLITNTYYTSVYSGVRTGFGQVIGGKDSVDFFLKNNLKGPIYNNFDIGSYLIYRLYPLEKVFVDGRPEAYPADFFTSEYIPMQENETKWKKEQEKWIWNSIIFSHTDLTPWAGQFIRRILRDQNWKMVYFDHYAVIFIRKNFQDDKIELLDTPQKITDFAIAKIFQLNNPGDLGTIGRFLDTIGMPEIGDTAYKRIEKYH